ncbi:MAG: hypothetical protein AABY22_22960 [Nanoarchaeota archaeon]
MKIGNNLRNLLLRQEETYAMTSQFAVYLGEKYTYKKVKKEDILKTINKITKIIETRRI